MNLPNAEQAIVETQKVVGYLLNDSHPDNGGKARFFEGLGYGLHNTELLSQALCQLARSEPVVATVKSVHGDKYVLEGLLRGPHKKSGRVRTIWIIDYGAKSPRLVTAYPAG